VAGGEWRVAGRRKASEEGRGSRGEGRGARDEGRGRAVSRAYRKTTTEWGQPNADQGGGGLRRAQSSRGPAARGPAGAKAGVPRRGPKGEDGGVTVRCRDPWESSVS